MYFLNLVYSILMILKLFYLSAIPICIILEISF